MPKNTTMSHLRGFIKESGDYFGIYVNNARAKKLAARFLLEQRTDQDLEAQGLEHETITYSDPTGRQAVQAWFKSLIDSAQEVTA